MEIKISDLKKSGRQENKDLPEDMGEFVDGCYYAPRDN